MAKARPAKAEAKAEVEAGADTKTKAAPDTETPFTMSIPDAGRRYYNIGRAASYAAADDGHIPFVRIGRLKRALPRLIEKRLAGSND